ncbi:MAG: hypothetical protein KIT10_07645 [Flavobacteriales bacterium]|nr:hypothetical protein [Flavobacteriales bacterium]
MSLLKNWHWTRWLRAAMAGVFIAQGFASGDGIAQAIGAFFGIQAIFNTGCFGTGTCAPATATRNNSERDIIYHEIR